MIITPIQPTGDFSTCAVMFACVPVQIVDAYTKAETDVLLAGKQKTLIAGDNIAIELDGTINSTGGGASIHNDLLQRDAADAHPIGSISGLQAELDSKLSNLSFEEKYATFISQWNCRALKDKPNEYGRYNGDETFTLNEITDIGIDEAMCIWTDSGTPNLLTLGKNSSAVFRTTFAKLGNDLISNYVVTYWADRPYGDNNTIKSIRLYGSSDTKYPQAEKLSGLQYITNLETIYGVIVLKDVTFNIYNGLPTSLINCQIQFNGSYSYDLRNALNLSYDSVWYMINWWGFSSAPLVTQRTLTLHADIFDKITNTANPDYPQWSQLAALATSKNITIMV